ncbi:hypothetical protein [Sulfobacillus harzensis]|uniref:Uncharacterized protein n=1 Tax=Sulfobacillus harzensis TaxID=2729629 RepID=A0A7Y0L7A8_9FIRM|nr:hypothetical protein [Sulfobacillus harzensis]NMP24546.1 hypothetical protein [Sulfobacillus harzensis]
MTGPSIVQFGGLLLATVYAASAVFLLLFRHAIHPARLGPAIGVLVEPFLNS